MYQLVLNIIDKAGVTLQLKWRRWWRLWYETSPQTIGHTIIVTQRKWQTSYFVDTPSLNFTASRHFTQAQDHCRSQGYVLNHHWSLWSMGRIYPDWEEKQYLQHFRMSKDSSKIFTHMSVIFLTASESHFAFIQSLSSCSHRSLFRTLDQQKIIFTICQTSSWSSPFSWQPCSRHVRLMVLITVGLWLG